MRAIIETGGKQFRVAPDDTIRVPSLRGEPGDKVKFERVLYVAGDEGVRLGAPEVPGASVAGEIVKHGRGKKILVFKFKRRKRYKRTQGHRQGFTEVRIIDVSAPEGAASKRSDDETEVEGEFECADCGRAFDTERGLKTHQTRSHG